jgi:PAS domain S-box-containing protein
MAARKPDEDKSIGRRLERPSDESAQALPGGLATARDPTVDFFGRATEHWALVLDAVPDAVAILDTQHRIVFANRSMAQRLGVPRDECVGQVCHACIHGSNTPLALCPHSKMLEDGQEHQAQIHEELLGGDFVVNVSPLFDAEGRIVGAVHVARDITERVRADEAVREGEERFRDLAELLPQIIYEMDLEGRLTFVNRNAFEVFGYTQDDLQAGVNNLDMLVPQERERARRNMARILQGEDLGGNEYTAQRKDGSLIPIVIYSSPIMRDGRPVGLRGIIVDITQRKEAERVSAEAQEAAEAADRAKGEFLANMSHEIRTPLTSILSLTDLLADQELSAAERREHLHTIGRNAENLLALVNDVLDLSKIDEGKTELESIECSPQQIVEEVRSLMQIRANEKNLRLDVCLELPLPRTIRTDPVRLRQILVNLVGNAVKFTQEGGVQITIGCRRREDGRTQLRFEVADTGIGMTGDQLNRIFEAFTQADTSHTRRFGGTGLGLSISQKLTKMLGGEIEVHSEFGIGSTFILSLDLGPSENLHMLAAPDAKPREDKGPDKPQQDQRVQGRILLAEDDPDVRTALRLAIELSGARVEFAENGRIALQKALASEDEGEPYDLVLMDIQMPQVDGYDATRRLRQAGWEGPIVALTAHVMAGDREKCLNAGCDEYLAKPVRRADLIAMVARHLKPADVAAPLPSVISQPTAASPTPDFA